MLSARRVARKANWFARTCLRCSLRRRVGDVMADATGEVPAVLASVRDAIATMADPWAGLIWLQSSAVRHRLTALATGAAPISHDGSTSYRQDGAGSTCVNC